MVEQHIEISIGDLDRAKSLIDRSRSYTVITDKLIDTVYDASERGSRSKVVYTAPKGRALIIFTNPNRPEGDEPKDTNADAWYHLKFDTSGIPVKWVRVRYL